MEEPIYISKDTQMMYETKNPNKILYGLKICLWIIFLLIIVFSFIFRENIFKSMSWTTSALFFATLIGVSIASGGTKEVPTPIEIQFFKDYFIVYNEKKYYTRSITRREFNKFYYKDVKKIEYRKPMKKLTIYGKGDFKWFDYKKDGSLPDKPTYDKQLDGMCFFYKSPENNVDYVKLFEEYSPIKVNVSDV